MKNKNQRFVRWSLILQEYNLDIKHIKGKDNVMADALSKAKFFKGKATVCSDIVNKFCI